MFVRKPSVGRRLKFFIFRPSGFENLGFLTNARRACDEVKNSMGQLQGPQKVPIQGNQWVALEK